MRQFFQDNKWAIPILALLAIIPLCLNIFFRYGNLETGKDLRNVEWLAFWGSYIGGAATLIAVCLTLSQNRKVIKQNEKIFVQNQENLIFQEERSRLSLMPYMEARIFIDEELKLHKDKLQPPNGFIVLSNNQTVKRFSSDLPKQYHQTIESGMIEEINGDGVSILRASNINFVRLILIQKAPSLAGNIQLCVTVMAKEKFNIQYINPPFVLASGESVILPVLFDKDIPEGEYKFTLSFEDIEGRCYEQFFTIHHRGSNDYSFIPINNPRLQNEYSKNQMMKCK
ncbi:hypothetical protein [Metabacillus endolithicus]|uniref:Uncharacterized protein n=1 Tax=Metabacillus endolithicus TaxID=1535204 RepID=A0ABW5C103_9BACI|nr:hypothetical protein [Metabacillus endolithicus]UPG61665.1 hypothetical protein MVE64_13205 [Metabacillus endolithicus]